MYDDILTIYNIVNGKGYKTEFQNIHFEANSGVAVEGTGMKENDNFLCLIPLSSIPEGKRYINWKSFQDLSENEKQNYFTFKNGDKVVKGSIEFEIDNTSGKTIADLERNFVDVFTVTNFCLRRMQNSNVNHFELSGK